MIDGGAHNHIRGNDTGTRDDTDPSCGNRGDEGCGRPETGGTRVGTSDLSASTFNGNNSDGDKGCITGAAGGCGAVGGEDSGGGAITWGRMTVFAGVEGAA